VCGTSTGRRAGSVAGRGGGESRATAGAASALAGSAGAGPITRFLRTSTVTVFERPCEKL
jgi:hypothetical protein